MSKTANPEQPGGEPWNDDGSGEPTGNRGTGDTSPPSGVEYEGGTRGDKAGTNQEQDAHVRGKP